MGIGPLNTFGGSYFHSNATANTTLKTGVGVLVAVVVNQVGTTPAINIFDNTAASGTQIAALVPTAVGTIPYNATFATGLTVGVTTTGGDYTFIYQ